MALTHTLHPKPTVSVVIKPFKYCPSSSSLPLFSSKFQNGDIFLGATFSRIQTYHNPLPALTRRLFLPSVSGLWDALTSGNSARDAVMAIRRGMQLFRQKKDKHNLNWLRLVRYEEGAEQFRLDVAQNPNDTEESIWCFLCEAQLYGVGEARKRYLEVGRDSRPVMREAYNMFKDGGDPENLVAAFSSGQPNEYFYASLYAGLYYESQNEPDAAKFHLIAACQSAYGSRSDDYMAALAKVHCKCRNWNLN
ncbi:uncharacterized protein [Nicotiana tomentosiformis]|uniref:uncharacterized protein isoform X3 n=1 Tax=Nicotiana tomentosiformis TaxID=4098 RepID=UPI00087812CF|nr:uncharacterized protein LOC104105270 isoform X2 [Nicotiana tomentosiformis]